MVDFLQILFAPAVGKSATHHWGLFTNTEVSIGHHLIQHKGDVAPAKFVTPIRSVLLDSPHERYQRHRFDQWRALWKYSNNNTGKKPSKTKSTVAWCTKFGICQRNREGCGVPQLSRHLEVSIWQPCLQSSKFGSPRTPRPLASVILNPEMKNQILQDIQDFFASAAFYKEQGRSRIWEKLMIEVFLIAEVISFMAILVVARLV